MHSPAANSQQGERHQQQPQRCKGYDNKTEEPVVRVNKLLENRVIYHGARAITSAAQR